MDIYKYTLDNNWFSNDKDNTILEHLNISKNHFKSNLSKEQILQIKSIIVPHASYFFSGICMASAYNTLLDNDNKPLFNHIKTVIVLSTLHLNYNGIYTNLLDNLNNEILEKEHSFQINLPYIKLCFPDANIIPIFVGRINDDELDKYSAFIDSLNNNETFFIINSDLNHTKYTDKLDNINREFCSIIAINDNNIINEINNYIKIHSEIFSICGIDAIKLFMSCNFAKELNGKITNYYTSNNIIKNDNNVVGYFSMIFLPKKLKIKKLKNLLTDYEKNILQEIAEYVIINKTYKIPFLLFPSFLYKYGLFCTINIDNKLRGCVGIIDDNNNIIENIIIFSNASAYQDCRFKETPILQNEYSKMNIKITLIDKSFPTTFNKYKKQINNNGIIIYDKNNNCNKALFLPSVSKEYKWTANDTLINLLNKANLNIDILDNLINNTNKDYYIKSFNAIDF